MKFNFLKSLLEGNPKAPVTVDANGVIKPGDATVPSTVKSTPQASTTGSTKGPTNPAKGSTTPKSRKSRKGG